MFVSFLSRYSPDTGNQIYLNCKTRIWNLILLVLILCTTLFQICLWISPCSSMLWSLSFNSATENFEFRWSIAGLILKALSVLSSFLVSALCSEYCHYWLVYLLSNYSAIVDNSLIAITKFIPRNAFSSALVSEVSSILMGIKIWLLNYQF